MREVLLSNSTLVALVDDADFASASAFRWRLKVKKGNYLYVVALSGEKFVYMHRLLMAAPPGAEVDHENGNGLDNRRSNLRLATTAQNQANQHSRRGGSSQFKGVYFERANKRVKRWRARISKDGKRIRLGCFLTEVEAAKAYDRAALEMYGEFANLNFPN